MRTGSIDTPSISRKGGGGGKARGTARMKARAPMVDAAPGRVSPSRPARGYGGALYKLPHRGLARAPPHAETNAFCVERLRENYAKKKKKKKTAARRPFMTKLSSTNIVHTCTKLQQ